MFASTSFSCCRPDSATQSIVPVPSSSKWWTPVGWDVRAAEGFTNTDGLDRGNHLRPVCGGHPPIRARARAHVPLGDGDKHDSRRLETGAAVAMDSAARAVDSDSRPDVLESSSRPDLAGVVVGRDADVPGGCTW